MCYHLPVILCTFWPVEMQDISWNVLWSYVCDTVSLCQVEDFRDRLEAVMLKSDDGVPMMPELYSVPAEVVSCYGLVCCSWNLVWLSGYKRWMQLRGDAKTRKGNGFWVYLMDRGFVNFQEIYPSWSSELDVNIFGILNCVMLLQLVMLLCCDFLWQKKYIWPAEMS